MLFWSLQNLSEAISLSDKVIVLSKRPAVVKKIHEIIYKEKKLPVDNRNTSEFNSYYEKIWKDLDINVQ